MSMTDNRLQKLKHNLAPTTGPKHTNVTQTSPKWEQKNSSPPLGKNPEEDKKWRDISLLADIKQVMRRN